jgi:hypothetical protein
MHLKERYKYAPYGIGFWAGGGIYSFINMIMNLNQVSQSKVLNYNYIITGAAVIGLIFNIFLLKKSKQEVSKQSPE